MKKSFVLYIDHLSVLDELTDEQAGQLFKAINAHVNNKDYALNGLLNAVFIPFRNQIDRDTEKYNKIIERNKINGKKGGRPKTQSNPKKPTGLSGNPKNPKKPDTDTDNVNENDNVNKNIYPPEFEEFWINYPRKRRGSKEAAYKSYKKALSRDSHANILAGCLSYSMSDEVRKGYAKGAAAWLNDDRWLNDYTIKGNEKHDRIKQDLTDWVYNG